MPTNFLDDETPIVQFDLRLEISAFVVFRRLRDKKPMSLMDVRSVPEGYTLEGAEPWQEGWEPPSDRQVVLFDEDGKRAIEIAGRLQEEGHTNVKALFGGLELWKFSLDPEIVGQETFLVKI